MKIAIIGSGLIGATLARKLNTAGHDVLIANSRGPESLAAFAKETGVGAATPEQAVAGAEVVIISVPFPRIPDLKALLGQLPAHTIVADTSNYFPHRDGAIDAVDAGQVESLWVCEQLGRPVVKAWNTILAGSLANCGTTTGTPNRIALPIAGDDDQAVAIVSTLVDQTGFDAVPSGSLADSWRQQPGTPVYCTDLTAAQIPAALQRADREQAPHNRDKVIRALIAHVGGNSFDQMTPANNAWLLQINRELAQ